jgi:hypothetical protein
LPVFAANPSGVIGFLIYQVTLPTPSLLVAQGGLYQAGLTIENQTLVVKSPIYKPEDIAFEPSAVTTTVYGLDGNRLVSLSEQTSNTTIRLADWHAAFTEDPWILTGPERCPDAPQSAADVGALCVLVAPFGSDTPSPTEDPDSPVMSGYILATEPLFGDIDGDGVEEAILLIQSGASRITEGFLVYRQADSGPRLVAALAAKRAGIQLTQAGTALEVTTRVIDDPSVPSTRFRQATYNLKGDILTLSNVAGFGPE